MVILPKPVIYIAFVATLVITLTAGINLIQAISIGLFFEILKYVLLFLGAGYLSLALAKTIVMKFGLKRLKSMY